VNYDILMVEEKGRGSPCLKFSIRQFKAGRGRQDTVQSQAFANSVGRCHASKTTEQ